VLGIGGPLTYTKNDALRKIMADVPHDRILLETDCPYLTPHPHRGKRNEPAYITYVGEVLARLWSMDVSEVTRLTTENAHRTLTLPRFRGIMG
jgi:TatD DNase family protein